MAIAYHLPREPAPRTPGPATPPGRDGFPTIAQAPHARENEPYPMTRSVYELSDSGQDTVSIARELDEQIGKVELILALRAG